MVTWYVKNMADVLKRVTGISLVNSAIPDVSVILNLMNG